MILTQATLGMNIFFSETIRLGSSITDPNPVYLDKRKVCVEDQPHDLGTKRLMLPNSRFDNATTLPPANH